MLLGFFLVFSFQEVCKVGNLKNYAYFQVLKMTMSWMTDTWLGPSS